MVRLVPRVTYTGPFYTRRNPDVYSPDFVRGKPIEVSQGWLDLWRRKLGDNHLIEGDEGVHVDIGNDGIPDSGWKKAEIVAWLSGAGVDAGSGYKTKTTLLSLVGSVLSPPVEEEPVATVAEPTVVEETVEEILEE